MGNNVDEGFGLKEKFLVRLQAFINPLRSLAMSLQIPLGLQAPTSQKFSKGQALE